MNAAVANATARLNAINSSHCHGLSSVNHKPIPVPKPTASHRARSKPAESRKYSIPPAKPGNPANRPANRLDKAVNLRQEPCCIAALFLAGTAEIPLDAPPAVLALNAMPRIGQ